MKKITNWFRSWNDKNKEEYNERVLRQAEKQASKDVQPMVWNGKTYLAYQGIPLVDVEDLKLSLVNGIEQAQKTLVSFITTED